MSWHQLCLLSDPLSTFSWSSPPFSTFILSFTPRTFSILVANSISHTYSHAPCPPVSYPPQTHTLLPKMHCPAACLPFHWPIKQPELYGSTDSKYINYRGRGKGGKVGGWCKMRVHLRFMTQNSSFRKRKRGNGWVEQVFRERKRWRGNCEEIEEGAQKILASVKRVIKQRKRVYHVM